jgi:lon-related putative ATP-dependent protease
MVPELPLEKLYRKCDPQSIGIPDSPQIKTSKSIIGQERAVKALRFGLGIKEKGFNIYVAGRPGTGRTTAIERFLEEAAAAVPAATEPAAVPAATVPGAKQPAAFDWCYVNNFRDNYHPLAMRLPAGQGVKFQQAMERFIAQIARDIRAAFESEDYAAHREETVKAIQQQKEQLLASLNEQSRKLNFVIQATPSGLVTVPVRKGKPLTSEEFMGLAPEEQQAISQTQETLEKTIETVLRQVKGLDQSANEALQKLDREVVLFTIKHLISQIRENFQPIEDIQTYLDQVQADILENIADFKPRAEEPGASPLPLAENKPNPLKKYMINVLVDNAEHQGAPVVIERNPTYANLFGKIEQEAHFGALTTDFTLIRPGSMHKANGGYLVLPVEETLSNPLSWESLKRALQNKEITIEDAAEKMGMASTKSLKPAPIPLTIKVILVGRPDIYQALLSQDEHFGELFKVKADFDTQMERTGEHISDYVGFITRLCSDEHLCPLDPGAMARIVEHGSRLADDQEKLSTHFGEIADVIREASYYASTEDAPAISVAHVRMAIEERINRSAQLHERIQEMIVRDEIKIDVDGAKCGQVNGLSVIQMGDIEFGQPNRITVSIGLGREGLMDIEREAKLGGPLHTKGVLIMSGYLADKYAQDKPISLSARLVFEQSYSGVDGDSASSTELYAILSALSGLPIQQGIAVTGSVNQKGEVQAIGGVNEKIEGFFAICEARGLTGKQGVMIPESNVCNLMLKESILEAVQKGLFHVWAVRSIDEGIQILTGVSAGQRLPAGGFEDNSVHALVDKRLRELAERLAAFGKHEE